ncbi:hypothetical protein TNCV_140591 [Trichonephila clavipes]|uniref:Uncharacterized protein n=1 Tax=Trichonephila clavipes TaxID=2585209 RepID=A0A8X6RFG4_TRICX|nr:hypothetical protein TNCV_140591 [Trichonephila clavipes]
MPSIKTDRPLLYEMTSPSGQALHLRCHPINHHAPTTLLGKHGSLASHNELSRLSTISPKTANELMIKHFEHFGQ